MKLERLRELERILSPAEALEYGLITNNTSTIAEAIHEHGLKDVFYSEEPEPEDALEFAIGKLPANILTTLLKPHGYQPIPTTKKAKREKALSH